MKIIDWVKNNKVVLILLVVMAFLLFNSVRPNFRSTAGSNIIPTSESIGAAEIGFEQDARSISPILPPQDSVVRSNSETERIVVANSNIAMVVDNVRGTGDSIIDHADSIGGFMVTASYSQPNQSPFATITVRIPSSNLNNSLDFFRSMAIKVTSENLVGTDVTEQFLDIEARISTLNKTIAKFESILDTATQVQDILQVQRELINVQTQIDNLVGQRQAIEQNADLTKVTIYLSTDELALPYIPDKEFSPGLVLKQAVRSLVSTARSGANFVIWIGVYSLIWIPAVIIYIIYRKRKNRKPIIES